MEPFLIFAVFIVIAIFLRLLAGSFDADRIERYIRDSGGELVDRSWDPFGPGWFGEEDSRIYEIVYRDRDRRLHRAHVKTSLLSGVYLTNDRILDDALPHSVEEEKQRLKRRLAELERQAKPGCPGDAQGPSSPG